VTRRSLRSGCLGLLCASLVACAGQITVLRDSPEGGLVAYPIKNDGDVLSASGRGEAIHFIDERCGRRYRILREGEVPRVNAKIDKLWQGQMAGDRLWGVQFACSQ